ncbi:MAG TPA: YbhB/YbcL family Raf kinase inhibitor-like protein [Gammaproteobacteria bacterium]
MKLYCQGFKENQPIPEAYAFGVVDPVDHVALGDNSNPGFYWSGLPEGTRSLVLICHDPDVPSRPDDVNQAGRSVPADLPRVDFYHWVLVDLPADLEGIDEGEFCSGVTPGGKPGPEAPGGTRQGLNNYTDWFAGDAQMRGDYYGYDGPCPPWNDERLHHYVFTLYALDVERCPVDGRFGGPEVLNAISGHILGQASMLGTYTLNPRLRG